MNRFDLGTLLQSLEQQGVNLKLLAVLVACVIVALLLIVYLLRKNPISPVATAKQPVKPPPASATAKPERNIPQEPVLERRTSVADEIPTAPPTVTAVETTRPIIPPAPAAQPEPPVAAAIPAQQPKTLAIATALPHIPQESVLRRHYLTHIKYMIETTTFPRPSESVLRRHYAQLVDSIFEACVNDAKELDKLIRRYDEHRKATVR
jgi:type IV secretory pathway VirB10-like protein